MFMLDDTELANIKICNNCGSNSKLLCKHLGLKWYEYLCPKCHESEYKNCFPTEDEKIEFAVKQVMKSIKKELKVYEGTREQVVKRIKKILDEEINSENYLKDILGKDYIIDEDGEKWIINL